MEIVLSKSASQGPKQDKEWWKVDPTHKGMVPIHTQPADWVTSTLQFSFILISPATQSEIYRKLKTSHITGYPTSARKQQRTLPDSVQRFSKNCLAPSLESWSLPGAPFVQQERQGSGQQAASHSSSGQLLFWHRGQILPSPHVLSQYYSPSLTARLPGIKS